MSKEVFQNLREESDVFGHAEINKMLDRFESRSYGRDALVEAFEHVQEAETAAKAILTEEYMRTADPETIALWTNAWKVTGEEEAYVQALFPERGKDDPLRQTLSAVMNPKNPAHRNARQVWRSKIAAHIVDVLGGDPSLPNQGETVLALMAAQKMSVGYTPEKALVDASTVHEDFDSRPERTALAKNMRAGKEMAFVDLQAPVESLHVLTGGALLKIHFESGQADQFEFKNFFHDEMGKVAYAQMKNGCEGNLVRIRFKDVEEKDEPEDEVEDKDTKDDSSGLIEGDLGDPGGGGLSEGDLGDPGGGLAEGKLGDPSGGLAEGKLGDPGGGLSEGGLGDPGGGLSTGDLGDPSGGLKEGDLGDPSGGLTTGSLGDPSGGLDEDILGDPWTGVSEKTLSDPGAGLDEGTTDSPGSGLSDDYVGDPTDYGLSDDYVGDPTDYGLVEGDLDPPVDRPLKKTSVDGAAGSGLESGDMSPISGGGLDEGTLGSPDADVDATTLDDVELQKQVEQLEGFASTDVGRNMLIARFIYDGRIRLSGANAAYATTLKVHHMYQGEKLTLDGEALKYSNKAYTYSDGRPIELKDGMKLEVVS